MARGAAAQAHTEGNWQVAVNAEAYYPDDLHYIEDRVSRFPQTLIFAGSGSCVARMRRLTTTTVPKW